MSAANEGAVPEDAMAAFLIAARTLHFAATVSLVGLFAFTCLIAGPALRDAGAEFPRSVALRKKLQWLAWASVALALLSGAVWLVVVAADMSGKPLGATMTSGVVAVVLRETRFGEVWRLRSGALGLLAVCVFLWNRKPLWRPGSVAWTALMLGGLLLGSLAWAGHGAATEEPNGDLHLAADILHLLAAGTWVGSLVPLALLLAEAQRDSDAVSAVIARDAARRFSTLGVASVATLLVSGIVNTLFLAGTLPSLVGTAYGQRLLAKIALFFVMVTIAAVNRLRLTPRLAKFGEVPGEAVWRSVSQLRCNALAEACIGLGVLAIVGALGILPPGLHTEPRWPFPFRLDVDNLAPVSRGMLAVLAVFLCGCAVAASAIAAAGRYHRAAAPIVGMLACLALGSIPLRSALERAYPTSFYASTEPYAAPSVVHGAALYARDCVLCHGASGRGDGPAAASLAIRPADLTEAHLFAHSPGDLYWWIGHGRDNGVMPGFAGVLTPAERWDVINFISARAAGVLAGGIGPEVTTAAAPELPDFAFETGGAQNTLRRMLEKGAVLLVLFVPPAPMLRLQRLAADEPRLNAAGLHVIAVGLGASTVKSAPGTPYVVEVSPDVVAALALFRRHEDGGETDLMLDRNGKLRARWTAGEALGLASPATFVANTAAIARFAVGAPSHAGHAQ
jgi:copper resistance protein D